MRDVTRMQAVQPAIIPIIADLVRRTPGTISLAQGVVSYGPPPGALRVLTSPLGPDVHRYGPVTGEPALVEAIAAKLAAENGIRVGGDRRVAVTAGSNMAFGNAVLATTRPGDEVILQAPFYFNHDMAVAIAGCRTIAVPTGPGWQLRPDAIEAAITPRTRAVVTVSPNNPSGAVYDERSLRAVNALCRERGLYHVHDEAYEYFTYDDARHFSPGAIADGHAHTISLFSLSKTYGMAGWRIGYMLMPAALFEPVNKIQDTNLICPAILSQRLARAALAEGSGYCRDKVRDLDAVRRTVLALLSHAGDRCALTPPQGAFYCLVTVDTALSPLAIAERLITRHRVAVVPGSAFGLEAQCTLRVSYGALDRETVAEGIGRLVEGLRRECG